MIRTVLQIDKATYMPTRTLSSKPANELMLISPFYFVDLRLQDLYWNNPWWVYISLYSSGKAKILVWFFYPNGHSPCIAHNPECSLDQLENFYEQMLGLYPETGHHFYFKILIRCFIRLENWNPEPTWSLQEIQMGMCMVKKVCECVFQVVSQCVFCF